MKPLRSGLLLFLLLATPRATVSASPAGEAIEGSLRVERALLELDLAEHDRIRRRESAYRGQIESMEEQVVSKLRQRPVPLDELELLDDTLAAAHRAAHRLALRGEELRSGIYERWRRIALLEIELDGLRAQAPSTPDPISGRWTVQILPMGVEGSYELALDGTLVSGSYRMTTGEWGSLRGTFVGSTLRLERIDGTHGFDIVLEGTLSEDGGRVDGSWTATLLTGGGPGNGLWSAAKEAGETEARE